MRNPLNAGAQVNVTSPLFDENKNYLYSNLELTPNVFAHIAMSLCRGTQRSRGDVITGGSCISPNPWWNNRWERIHFYF